MTELDRLLMAGFGGFFIGVFIAATLIILVRINKGE